MKFSLESLAVSDRSLVHPLAERLGGHIGLSFDECILSHPLSCFLVNFFVAIDSHPPILPCFLSFSSPLLSKNCFLKVPTVLSLYPMIEPASRAASTIPRSEALGQEYCQHTSVVKGKTQDEVIVYVLCSFFGKGVIFTLVLVF